MKKLILLIVLMPLLLLVSACDEETYKVTFVDHNGKVLHVLEPEGTVVPPEDPLRDGYVFDGWYTDSEYLDMYDEYDYDDVLTEDITIYAKWAPAVYTVTVEYGPGIDSQEIDYTYGEEIEIPNPPIKKGYVLDRFYVNDTQTVEFDPEFSPTQDFTIYASWLPKTVTINYYENAPLDIQLFSIGVTNTHIVTKTGSVYAWGMNLLGMLGTKEVDEFYEALAPVDITDNFDFAEGETIIQFSKAEHVLALTSEHRVFGWGGTPAFQLGYASGVSVKEPRELTSDLPLNEGDYVISVSAGFRHSVFLTNEGNLIVTGDGDFGQLGYAQNGEPTSFVDVTDEVPLNENEKIEKVYAYSESTLIYTSHNRVLVTGRNVVGELGTGNNLDRSEFTDITSQFDLGAGEQFLDFQFGDRYVLVLTDEGNVYSFGNNEVGQLGIGSTQNSNVPTKIAENIREIHAAENISALIDTNGSLYMFGYIPYRIDNFDSGATGPVVTTVELMFENFFDEVGPFSDFNLGRGFYWFKIDNEYRGYGDNDFNQLLDWYNGVLLNDYIPVDFMLTHTEEATYGEHHELYFPEPTITSNLTSWYLEEEMIHRYFGNTNLAYEELDLYGVWETRYYMLTIYENNGTQGYIQEYAYEEYIHLYATRSGYVLEGWYLDEELTIPFTYTSMPNQDLTIYAKWSEVVPEVITVPYDGVLSSEHNEALFEFTIDEGQHFLMYGQFDWSTQVTLLDGDRNPIDDLENLMYNYNWTDDEQLLMSELLPAGTYYIHLLRDHYYSDIYFGVRIALGEYFEPTYNNLEIHFYDHVETEIILGGMILDIEHEVVPMKHFAGWYLDAEFTIPFNAEFMPNEDTVIYAKYEDIPIIELTFDVEDYTGDITRGESNYYTFTLTEETMITVLTISSMDTYGVLYDENMNVIRSNDDYNSLDFRIIETLQAGTYYLEVRGLSSYEEGPYTLIFVQGEYIPPSYTITYVTNGGDPIDPIILEVGEHIPYVTARKDGFVFAGWYLDEELTIPFEVWNMPNHDVTLYADYFDTIPLDISTLPLTISETLLVEELLIYSLEITEETTLQFDVTATDLFFIVLQDGIELNPINDMHVPSGTSVMTVTLTAGDYFVAAINDSSELATDFEMVISIPE